MAQTATSSSVNGQQSIYYLTHDIHQTVTRSIDTALSWDQLNSPSVNYTLVRPIVDRFVQRKTEDEEKKDLREHDRLRPSSAGMKDARDKSEGDIQLGAVLYALMANRIQFITLAEGDLSYAPLQNARAAFCELLAMKVLRAFPDQQDEAAVAEALVHGWSAFEGAPAAVWESMGEDRTEVEDATGSALELAIVSSSKHFLSLPLIQHLINQIYTGHLIYLPVSSRSLISDSYVSDRTRKRRNPSTSTNNSSRFANPTHARSPSPSRRPKGKGRAAEGSPGAQVFVYDPYEAGWLDHQRLRVPKWRNYLECLTFAILIGLYIATLATRDIYHIHPIEILYILYSFGFILDEFASSKEHGWSVYSANAWNAFDLVYIGIFILFFMLRVFALATHSPTSSDLAFDILSCAACILFPRLVFYLIKDQVVIIALRAMIARFLGFMGLTIMAFSGICFCLWTLGRATWTVKQIIWLMLQIWFGSSYLGFSASESFHPIFGPIILISYAALCNVLLITILIAILSNKFAEINGNAQEEHLFQRVLKTVEGVRSDAIFSYLPPVNLLAFVLLMPLSWVCEPRTLHRINVFGVRATNFPILFLISAYERWSYRSQQRSLRLETGPNGVTAPKTRLLDSWLAGGAEGLIASVFEAGPPPSLSITPAKPPTHSQSSSDSDSEPQIPSTHKVNSPLAKLYGLPTAASRTASQNRKRKDKRSRANTPATEVGDEMSEVIQLKKELAEVRGSQLRVEEMMGRLLAGREQ